MNPFQLYKQSFVRDFNGPFTLQTLGEKWHTRRHKLTDDFLSDHLDGKYWLGTRGPWYPQFAFLDFDFAGENIAKRAEIIGRAIDVLELSDSQYNLMTSPSHSSNGSCHLIFRPVYRGTVATLGLIQKILRRRLGNSCEIYPQKRRCFRLPFGRDQYLVGSNGKILTDLNWEECVHFAGKLDFWEIPPPDRQIIRGTEKIGNTVDDDNTKSDFSHLPSTVFLGECETLLDTGLTGAHSRHFAQWKLIKYFYRCNWIPDDAKRTVKKWIRQKHNNFSIEASTGNWREIDSEIDRQTDWIYRDSTQLPDAIHNLDAEITPADLWLAANIYRGDAVNQKRLVDLLAYCRPRAHHAWIYIPFHEWARIANKTHYHRFIRDLEVKNIISSDWRYRHNPNNKADSFCRRFRLKIKLSDASPLQTDRLNVTNFYEAWLLVCAGDVRRAAEATGLTTQRFYYYKTASNKKSELIINVDYQSTI